MASKKCPMCDTLNAQDAQSCKYCGYIFEDFSNTAIINPSPVSSQQPTNDIFLAPPIDTTPIQPTVSTGSALFIVPKSILSSLVPGIIYLLFVVLISTASGFSIYSLGVIAVFILVAVAPVLFAPRKYEFYDDSLRITRIIGNASNIPYSNLEIRDYPSNRRPRIILSVIGKRRSLIIPGNPTSAELGEDLNQFLHKKLKNYDTKNQSPSDAPANTSDASSQP